MSETNKYKDLANSLNIDKDGIPRARRIRANLCAIEELLDTGLTTKFLVESLNKNGFEVTLNNFNIELYRARKLLKKQAENNPVTENKEVNTVTTTLTAPVITEKPISPPVKKTTELTKEEVEEKARKLVIKPPIF
jgi:hypothetical protein